MLRINRRRQHDCDTLPFSIHLQCACYTFLFSRLRAFVFFSFSFLLFFTFLLFFSCRQAEGGVR